MKRICMVPRVSGVGGMVSFRDRFRAGLIDRGFGTTDDIRDESIAVLVIGGTRDLAGLWRAKRRGIRIVQRLNGMNWLHRTLKTGLRHYLRAEYGNFILRLIRSRFADHIVYQSHFAKEWWERVGGKISTQFSIITNAVDLDVYSPRGTHSTGKYILPEDRYRVLLVEGSLMGGYELGLDTAVSMVQVLNVTHSRYLGKPVELIVAGRVSEGVRSQWADQVDFPLVWAGLVPSESIPELDRAAHLLYSADINAACPNAVIEALACGIPVLAYDTGALPELVSGDAGRVVPYGGDPWLLEVPDIPALAAGALEILTNQVVFRTGARQRAEILFGLDTMVESYLSALIL